MNKHDKKRRLFATDPKLLRAHHVTVKRLIDQQTICENDAIGKFLLFDEAQRAAEKSEQEEFTCPLCGGRAWWSRSAYNNHLHSGCKDCGFLALE